MSARLAHELRFKIGQSDVIQPAIGIDDDRMSAAIVAAADQQASWSQSSRFPKSDFLLSFRLYV
jgi:hypothetical protein